MKRYGVAVLVVVASFVVAAAMLAILGSDETVAAAEPAKGQADPHSEVAQALAPERAKRAPAVLNRLLAERVAHPVGDA